MRWAVCVLLVGCARVDEDPVPTNDAGGDTTITDVAGPNDSVASPIVDAAPDSNERDSQLPSTPDDAAPCDAAGYPDMECPVDGCATGERCSPCNPCSTGFYCLTGCCIKFCE
jgi:hypothetical protein